jgi:hypothetical protein
MAARKPPTLAQTIRRRTLLTGGSEAGALTGAACLALAGVVMPLATGAVGVEETLAAPSATRVASVVPEGNSLVEGAFWVLPAEGFESGLLSTPQTSICLTG